MQRSEIRESRDARPGLRFAPSGSTAPGNKTGLSDLPVGRFLERAVESYFWFSEKYFCSQLPQITSTTLAIPSHRGAYPDRQRRGMGCGGRGSVRRATWLQGG